MQFSTLHVTHGAPSTVDALIADRALWAVFQPIVRLADGEIAGHEGLIRGPADTWLETPRGLFAQAQQEGAAHRLEIAAAQVCCESFARLHGAGLLFVNASAAVIDACVGEDNGIASLLGSSELAPERVVIELTEQSVIADLDRFDATVRALRTSGAAFALDDYGSANASMNLWVRLAPNYVKIDRFFIDNIALDPLKFEAVKAMFAFCKSQRRRAGCRGYRAAGRSGNRPRPGHYVWARILAGAPGGTAKPCVARAYPALVAVVADHRLPLAYAHAS